MATDVTFLQKLVAVEVLELEISSANVDCVTMCVGLTKLKRLYVEHSADAVQTLRSLPHIEDIDVEF